VRSPNRGLSIAETIVGVGIFSMIIAMVMAAMVQSFKIWNRTASQTATEEVLFKIHNLIYKDLTNTAPDLFATSPGLATIGAVQDSNALWCLSFIDPLIDQPVYGDGTTAELGEPVWQRNIMYYAVVPNGHDAWAGQSCTGADGGEGFEDQCPHKVLVRKVIDDPVAGVEPLLASSATYLDRPTGIDTSAMAGAGLEEVRIVGTNILSFRAEPESHSVGSPPDRVKIVLKANAIDEAKKTIPVGNLPLSRQPTTLEREFRVFPKNGSGDAP
jgi:hypothetical protein